LVDGGYPKVAMLMDPAIRQYDYCSVMWSEWLESIRKDVECVFSNLKNRFRFLRNKIPYGDYTLISNAMRVAAILHNRLLAFDDYLEFDWNECDPDGLEPFEFEALNNLPSLTSTTVAAIETFRPQLLTQHPVGSQENPIQLNPGHYEMLKNSLIKNLSYAYNNCRLEWPKHFTTTQKENLPLLERAIHRTTALTRILFRVAPSNLRRRNATTLQFTEPIGNGLFATRTFRPGEHIIHFIGEIINRQELQERTAAGRGGYILANRGETQFLDCYETAQSGRCLASMANSPLGCRFAGENGPKASANSKLVVSMYSQELNLWSLKARKTIKEGEEILFRYSRNYVFPEH
jgi:hypothetical protein